MEDLSATQRQEVERLTGQVEKLRGVVDSILSLAEELKGNNLTASSRRATPRWAGVSEGKAEAVRLTP